MKAQAQGQVKLLNPRSADTKIMGDEPTWRSQPRDNRVSAVSKALNWYNYFYGKKDAREMIVAYLERHNRRTDVRSLRGVPDSAIKTTAAWLCRMSMVGLELTSHEQNQLDMMLAEILNSKTATVPQESETTVVLKPNIQDRLREKAAECAGELEGMFDSFVAAGAKMTADYRPIATIRGMNVAPQLIGMISDIWQRRCQEIQLVIQGKDSQLVEGYGNFSKIQLRNCVKFCETVIADCGAYRQIKKVERKPRKTKPVSPEKRTAKFKHAMTCTDPKLQGLAASSLVNSSEAWLYDCKKRKLIHLVADAHTQTFTVKSNAIIGFNPTETQQKTLRKPPETLKALLAAGKPAARKLFRELTTTDTAWNGRGTENLVILRVW